jgi:hypothetical protein
MEIQRLMSEAFNILKKNPVIFLPAFVLALLVLFLDALLPIPKSPREFSIYFASFGILFLLSLFLNGLIIRMVYDVKRGKLFLGKSAKFVYSKYLTLLGATIIFSIIIVLGLIAFILPGIYLLVRLYFYDFAILIDNEKACNSLRRSWKIMKGKWWDVFALFVVALLPLIVIAFLAGFVAGYFSLRLKFISVFNFFATLFYIPWFYTVLTLAYLKLRKK